MNPVFTEETGGNAKNVIVIVHKLQVRFIRGVFASLRHRAVQGRDHPGLSYINQITRLVNSSHQSGSRTLVIVTFQSTITIEFTD